MATEIYSADTCARCNLKRATRGLEEKGISVRLCDDCYWGKESPAPQDEPVERAGQVPQMRCPPDRRATRNALECRRLVPDTLMQWLPKEIQ